MDKKISTRSTSAATSEVTPIVLEQTNRKRLQFLPQFVNNPHDCNKCISGKLLYEKKQQHDKLFPSDIGDKSTRVRRGTVRSGDWMEIELDTTQTQLLFEGLTEYYQLYKEIGKSPMGENTYTKVDSNVRTLLTLVKENPSVIRQLANEESLDLVRTLLKIIISADFINEVQNALSSLEREGLEKLNNAVSIDKLLRVKNTYEQNIENANEEFWQEMFKQEQWILAQLFGRPMTIFQDKAYVGGKNITNANGHICDFLYQNSVSKNIALIEIKTPVAKLMGREYRGGVYPASESLAGAIAQVLTYKDALLKEYNALSSGANFNAINPLCVVIIGTLKVLSPAEKNSFDLFRSSLSGVTVVTYDELLTKISDLIDVLQN